MHLIDVKFEIYDFVRFYLPGGLHPTHKFLLPRLHEQQCLIAQHFCETDFRVDFDKIAWLYTVPGRHDRFGAKPGSH